MSQRRRQARLLSLRFTGPPPPPRLCGPRPARPSPAAGGSPHPAWPPRLGARWGAPTSQAEPRAQLRGLQTGLPIASAGTPPPPLFSGVTPGTQG